MKVDPDKVLAISEWEEPNSVSAVRSFLGFSNFYREFIPRFSAICEPLNKLTKRGAAWEWDKSQKTAFESLKQLLTSSPVLTMFDPDAETVLEADSSGYAIGGVVSQVDNKGRLRPAGFFSRKLSPAEANYEIHDKELLAILATIKHFRGELRSVSRPFTILSDHRNLCYFMSTRKLSERQVRWAEELADYNFEIKFRPGNDSTKPDLLSRKIEYKPKDWNDERLKKREFQLLKDRWISPALNPTSFLSHLSLSAMVTRGQARGQNAEKVVLYDDQKTHINKQEFVGPPKGKHLFQEKEIQVLWDKSLKEDQNFHLVYTSVKNGDRSLPSSIREPVQMLDFALDHKKALTYRGALWVPDWEPLRTSLIQRVHDSHVTGHPGREITLAILARDFFWPQQYKDVRRFVRNCHVCGRSKIWRQSRQGLLRPLPIPERFHSELAIDFMTDLPLTSKGEKFLMVIHDRLLGSVTLEAMSTMEAEACAEKFIQSHWRYHSFPNFLTSERGFNWISHFSRKVCQ